jgi:hypothetical protein
MTSLRDGLEQLYGDGIGWPCLGNELWVSDDPDERGMVAPLCLTCPVLIDCRLEADAHDEQFGIWAGADRTSKPNRPAQRRTAA